MARSNIRADFAANNDRARLNFSLNARALPDNQRVGGVDFATKNTIDSDCAAEGQTPLKFTALVDHPGNGYLGRWNR